MKLNMKAFAGKGSDASGSLVFDDEQKNQIKEEQDVLQQAMYEKELSKHLSRGLGTQEQRWQKKRHISEIAQYLRSEEVDSQSTQKK